MVASTEEGAFFASGYRGEGAIAAITIRNSLGPPLASLEYSSSVSESTPWQSELTVSTIGVQKTHAERL